MFILTFILTLYNFPIDLHCKWITINTFVLFFYKPRDRIISVVFYSLPQMKSIEFTLHLKLKLNIPLKLLVSSNVWEQTPQLGCFSDFSKLSALSSRKHSICHWFITAFRCNLTFLFSVYYLAGHVILNEASQACIRLLINLSVHCFELFFKSRPTINFLRANIFLMK